MVNIAIAIITIDITAITTGISQGLEYHWGENHSLPSATRTATVVPHTHLCVFEPDFMNWCDAVVPTAWACFAMRRIGTG